MEAECADSNRRVESLVDDAPSRGELVIEALPPHMDGLLVSGYGQQGSSMNGEKRPEVEGSDAGAAVVQEPMPRDHEQVWLRELHRTVLAAFDEQLKRALIRRGAAPEVLAGPELSVSLSDISIIDWIQAIQLFAKHAIITVIHDDTESRLWCSSGELVDAESGRLRGEAALYRIVGIERGQVVTELREEPRARTIRASTPGLLLEAARRKDESALLRGRLGDLGRCFQGAGRRPRALDAGEAATFDLFSRPRRLVDVLSDSVLGDLETLAVLDRLIRAGRLVEAPAAELEPPPSSALAAEDGTRRTDSVAPLARSRPPERNRVSNGRWWGSTAVVALSVAFAGWLGARGAAWSTGPSSIGSGSERASSSAPSAATRELESFPVMLRTYPAHAELQIDGRSVGKGEWRGSFARDGSIHELRAVAAGFVPLRVIFIDTAPPFDLHLEPLPGRGGPSPSSAMASPPAAADNDASGAAPADLDGAGGASTDAALALAGEKPSAGADGEPEPRGRSARSKSLAAASRAPRRAAAAERAGAARAAPMSEDEDAAGPPPNGKRKPYVQLIEGEPERAAGLSP